MQMPRQEIKNESIAFQVYNILKEQIINGTYLPGDKISEQAIADHFKISRGPVREAIRKLASENMIDYYPQKGAFAKNYTEKNIQDCFSIRLLFEQYAIKNIKPELREQYMEKMRDMKEKISSAKRSEYNVMDEQLHEMVIKLCGNDTLLYFYRLLYSQILLFRGISLVDDDMFQLATRSHIKLLEKLMEGNDSKALNILSKHLSESEELVQKHYIKSRENAEKP